MELFGSDDFREVFRNDAVLEFQCPAAESAEFEGFHDAFLESVASKVVQFFRIRRKGFEVFPYRTRSFAKHGIAFFVAEVFEDVDFGAVCPVFFQVICVFARFLGEFSQEFSRRFAAGESVFDAVQSAEVAHSDGDVRIGERVGSAEFETRSCRAGDVADEAGQDGTVTSRNVRRFTAESRNDADRSFEARFQAVEGVRRRRYEGVDDFVVFEDTHDSAVADGREESALHVIRVEEVDEFAILHDSADTEVSMFTGAGNTVDWFSLEGDFEAVFTEDFADDDTGSDFVISCLYRVAGVFPVDFELFEDKGQFTGIVDLGFDAADFFMAHFRFEAVFFKAFDGLFKRRADDAVCTLPVLFLHLLGCRQEAGSYVLARGLDPEFQFCSRREDDFFDVIRIDGRAFDAVFLDKSQNLVAYVVAGVAKDGTGVDEARSMAEEARDTERTDGFARFRIDIAVIVIDEPVDAGVGFDVDTSIGQGSDARQDNGRTVCLESRCIEEFIVFIEEYTDRNLFVRIVTGEVDAYERYKFNFRVLFE